MTEDGPRTLLIGDVHGCLDELERLLKLCGVTRGERIVFVGDLVAKGPDSAGVVALARELGAACVRGNHDEAVLAYLRAKRAGQTQPRLKKTHVEVGESLSKADIAYLDATPFSLMLGELLWVVHAGIVPSRRLADQDPAHLMTMRTLRPDGTPSARVDGGELWASQWAGPAHVVFGHDAITGLQQHPFATGLDTGCVYGKRLTALSWPDQALFHVDAKRAYEELEA